MKSKRQLWPALMTCVLILCYGCTHLAAKMSYGQRLYRSKCSSCHSVIAPENHDQEEWRQYIDKYGGQMTDEQKNTILEYLTAGGAPRTD